MQSTQWALLSTRQFSPQQCFRDHSSFSLWLCHFKCVAKASTLVSTEGCASEGFLGPVLPGSCAPTLSTVHRHTASSKEARQHGGFVIPGGTTDCAGPVGHAAECRRYSSSTCDTSIIMSKPRSSSSSKSSLSSQPSVLLSAMPFQASLSFSLLRCLWTFLLPPRPGLLQCYLPSKAL